MELSSPKTPEKPEKLQGSVFGRPGGLVLATAGQAAMEALAIAGQADTAMSRCVTLCHAVSRYIATYGCITPQRRLTCVYFLRFLRLHLVVYSYIGFPEKCPEFGKL